MESVPTESKTVSPETESFSPESKTVSSESGTDSNSESESESVAAASTESGGGGGGDVFDSGRRREGVDSDLDEVVVGEGGVGLGGVGEVGGGDVVAEFPEQDGDGEDAQRADQPMADAGGAPVGLGRRGRRNGAVGGAFFRVVGVGHGNGVFLAGFPRVDSIIFPPPGACGELFPAAARASGPAGGRGLAGSKAKGRRHWRDCVKCRFMSAGRDRRAVRAVRKLRRGTPIFAYRNGVGHVGFGVATDAARPVGKFQVDGKPLLECELGKGSDFSRTATPPTINAAGRENIPPEAAEPWGRLYPIRLAAGISVPPRARGRGPCRPRKRFRR